MKRLLPGLALLVCLPAHAAGPQLTDPTGDANGTGTVAPAPASLPAYDITSARWYADSSAQRVALTFAAAPGDGLYALTFATPSCATNLLEWRTGSTWTYLEGCKPRHRRWYKVPTISGNTITFTLPRAELPSWLAPGTTVSKIGVSSAPLVDSRNAQLHPEVDNAYADVKYVIGS